MSIRHSRYASLPAADAEAILSVYAPYVIGTAISFEEQPPTVDEMAERIEAGHLWLVAEDDDQILGYAYAAPFHRRPAYRWSVEVSIYLTEAATGRGVGKLLLGRLLDQIRARGFVNAFAGTTLPNARSIALFEISVSRRSLTKRRWASSSEPGTTSSGWSCNSGREPCLLPS